MSENTCCIFNVSNDFYNTLIMNECNHLQRLQYLVVWQCSMQTVMLIRFFLRQVKGCNISTFETN